MLFLLQLTSSFLYDLIFVVIFTSLLVGLIGSVAARYQKKSNRKLRKVDGVNRAQRRKELALSARRKN